MDLSARKFQPLLLVYSAPLWIVHLVMGIFPYFRCIRILDVRFSCVRDISFNLFILSYFNKLCFLFIPFFSHILNIVQVPVNTKVEAPKPSLTPEEMKIKAQELR